MPFAEGSWSPLFRLLREMDDAIAGVYVRAGVNGFRPNFAPAVLVLADGPRTIRDLARLTDVTHSAMSQKVAALRRADLVTSVPGGDARTRVVRLTDRGEDVARLVRREWDATEAALAELDAGLPRAVTVVVADLRQALADVPFGVRLARQLERPPEG